MKLNLENALFIPKSNVNRGKQLSFDNLVPITAPQPPKPEYDLVYFPTFNTWKINDKFFATQTEDEGWTAAMQDGCVLFLKTNNSLRPELRPRFLKTKVQRFRSSYFNLLASKMADLSDQTGFFLQKIESGIEGVEAYVLSSSPSVESEENEEQLF